MKNTTAYDYRNKIGLILICLYIFMCYNALNIIIPSFVNSIVLILLVGYTFLYVAVDKFVINASEHTRYYLVFMIFSFFTMVYSKEKSIFSGQYYLMISALIVSFCFQMFIKDLKSFRIMCWAYGIASGCLFITMQFKGLLVSSVTNRLGGDIFGNANIFAGLIMVAVLYEIWLFMYGNYKTWIKVILIAMLLSNLYALVLSAGRKYFVVAFIFFYILLVMKKDKHDRPHFIKNSLIALAIIGVAFYLVMNVPIFYDNLGHRLEAYIYGLSDSSMMDTSSAKREILRSSALDGWFSSMIFGHGFDSFKYYARDAYGWFYYSHCNYTELLYDGGIILFVVYYLIYVAVFLSALNADKRNVKGRAFAFGICIGFIFYDYGQVSYSALQIQIALAMAFFLVKNKEQLIEE